MKLLIITQVVDKNDDVLGAFHQWIRRFAEVFESVEVICLKRGVLDLPPNVRVHSLGKEKEPSRWRYLRLFYTYIFRYRRDYDAVFVHMNPEYVVLGGLFWRLWGKTTFLWYAHKHGSWLRLAALHIGDRVVSVSKESFVGSESPKFLAVGHGVDPDVYVCPARAAHGPKAIMHTGRLTPVKEYGLLIEAAAILRDRHGHNDFILKLVGAPVSDTDRAYVEGLKKRIAELGLTDVVEFTGSVPNKDLLPHLCAASSFVNMQDGGGAGKSFLEAMSCGVPTVVRTPVFNEDLGAWKDTLHFDGSAEDFAAKLHATLSLDEASRGRLAADLRRIVVEKHNLKNLVRRVRDEYESLRTRR